MKLRNTIALSLALATPCMYGFSRTAFQRLFTRSAYSNTSIQNSQKALQNLPFRGKLPQNLSPWQYEQSRQHDDMATDKIVGSTEQKLHAEEVYNSIPKNKIYPWEIGKIYNRLAHIARENPTAAQWYLKNNRDFYFRRKSEDLHNMAKQHHDINAEEEIVNPQITKEVYRITKKEHNKRVRWSFLKPFLKCLLPPRRLLGKLDVVRYVAQSIIFSIYETYTKNG